MAGPFVARKSVFEHLYAVYLLGLATLPLIVYSIDVDGAATADPGSMTTALAGIGLPLAIAVWAVIIGRRATPLVIDRATLLIKTRTPYPNGVALAGEVASHAGVIIFVATAVALLIAPELEGGSAWSIDVGTRLLALIGLATAGFGLSLSWAGRGWSAWVAITASIFAANAVAWGLIVRDPAGLGAVAWGTAALGPVGIVAASGALNHLSPERLHNRAQVVDDLRVGGVMLTPVHVLALLRVTRAPEPENSDGRRPAPTTGRWLTMAALAATIAAAATAIGGSPLRLGVVLGGLAYLLGANAVSPLTFLAQVSRAAPHTIPGSHLAWRTLRPWAAIVLVGAVGTALVASDRTAMSVLGVTMAVGAAGCCSALWSSVTRDLDLGSLLSMGGPEMMGIAIASRWLLPPLASVLLAVAAASAATPAGLAVHPAAVTAFLIVTVAAPVVAARPQHRRNRRRGDSSE